MHESRLPEALHCTLLDRLLNRLDTLELSNTYTPGMLQDLKILSPAQISFSFFGGDTWVLTVRSVPRRTFLGAESLPRIETPVSNVPSAPNPKEHIQFHWIPRPLESARLFNSSIIFTTESFNSCSARVENVESVAPKRARLCVIFRKNLMQRRRIPSRK